ncbi:MAG: hypothetical protein P8170_04570 [Gemmatimonadota bacterium]|jgi:BASS family bile acid:Na+ symporter
MTLPPRWLVGLLTLVLVTLMALLGAQVKLEYVREVLRRPRALIVGLAGQLLLLPLLAAALFVAFRTFPEIPQGAFIIAAVPGGAASNMVTYWGRGRLSLSVVLTACSTLAGVVTIPLWVNVGLRLGGGGMVHELSVLPMLVRSFVLLVVPLGIGMAVGAWKPALAERMKRFTRRVVIVMMIAVIVAYIAIRWPFIVAEFSLAVVFAAVLFDVIATLGGWGAARGFGLDGRDAFTIGIEVGIQNVVIALLIIEVLGRPDLLPFVGYYALVKMPLMIFWVLVLGQPEAVPRSRLAGSTGSPSTSGRQGGDTAPGFGPS